MTITFEDVRDLLGIPLTGKTVVVPFKGRKSLTAMVSRLLEVSMTHADEEIMTSDYSSEKPRVMKWHHKKDERLYKKETRLLLDHLVSFRRRLDKLRSHEVIWDSTLNGAPPVHDIAFYHGPMKFMDIVEPHNPIRVLRQMGYVQRIPRDPYRPIDVDRSRLGQLYSVKYSCTPKANLTVDDAYQMADQVIAFMSGAEHAYQSTTVIANQSKGGTTSTGDVLHYGTEGKMTT
ncbi:hypothetical protein Scep_022480 [Stephania cephalantha]|uniref:Uncharacterized protein n=1 Tax=Stephania cephalantha TaxID=152367 RepID=A0AAP0F5G9_9MAGN